MAGIAVVILGGLVAAFVVAHAVVLAICAGVLAVAAAGLAVASRVFLARLTIVHVSVPLRAPRTSRRQLPAPSFQELAERQATAISQRHVITTATVISRTEERTRP